MELLRYRTIGIISTGALIFKISSVNGCLYTEGAYTCGLPEHVCENKRAGPFQNFLLSHSTFQTSAHAIATDHAVSRTHTRKVFRLVYVCAVSMMALTLSAYSHIVISSGR